LRKRINEILQQEVVQNFLKIFSSNTVINVLPLVLVPIFSRVFFPEDYGQVALLVASSTLVASVASLRYELAIVLPKTDNEAFQVIKLSALLSIAFTLLLSLICFGIYQFDISNSITLLVSIPFATLFASFTNVARNWAVRKKYFGLIAKAGIAGLIMGTLAKFYWGFQNFNHDGLIYSALIGSSATMILLLAKVAMSMNNINWAEASLQTVATRYNAFVKYNVPQTLLDSLNTHGIIYLISAFYGTQLLGQYSMAEKFLKVPARFIGSAISPVFYQHATENFNLGKSFHSFTRKIVFSLSFIAIPAILITALFGENLFEFALGEQWALAGTVASIIIFWAMIRFISSPLSTITLVLKRNKDLFFRSLIYNVLLATSLIVSYLMNLEFIEMTLVITSVSAVYFTYLVYWFWNLSKHVYQISDNE
jgi:O-antigen/teichoic acid export membrane protein